MIHRTIKLPEKLLTIESLERVVEGTVPLINPHADVNIAQIEPDDSNQQPPGRPLFFRCPIAFGETPRGACDVSRCLMHRYSVYRLFLATL